MKIIKLFVCILLVIFTTSCSKNDKHPFKHDLHLTVLPGNSPKTMLCFHGYGMDYLIAARIKSHGKLNDTLVSFNFPDHGIRENSYDPEKTSFGSINEILPALYVMKKYMVDERRDQIVLYGYSAGGGALINSIAVLNTSLYDKELKSIGIKAEVKAQMLSELQKCTIILDTPLKSLDELIAFRPRTPELEVIAKRYKDNGLNPIDSLERLKDLSLYFIVHFQFPDEILSNRDDALFVNRLRAYNPSGKTEVILGKDGGHSAPHRSLWNYYNSL